MKNKTDIQNKAKLELAEFLANPNFHDISNDLKTCCRICLYDCKQDNELPFSVLYSVETLEHIIDVIKKSDSGSEAAAKLIELSYSETPVLEMLRKVFEQILFNYNKPIGEAERTALYSLNFISKMLFTIKYPDCFIDFDLLENTNNIERIRRLDSVSNN